MIGLKDTGGNFTPMSASVYSLHGTSVEQTASLLEYLPSFKSYFSRQFTLSKQEYF